MAEIRVHVVYSDAPRVVHEWPLCLEAGATVLDALQASGVQALLPGCDWALLEVGVWGDKAALTAPLREGDRVEIYRPLTVDPKVARRERFRQQGSRASGLFASKRPGAKAGY